MLDKIQKYRKMISLILAIIVFYAVFSQYIIRISKVDLPLWVITVNHFSFFTILTNILVGIFFLSQSIVFNQRLSIFFAKPATVTAISVYIFIVGLIFNIMLRKIYHPSGMEGVNNNLLHVFIPLAMIIYWILFAERTYVSYKNVFVWTIYPLCYVLYILIKGYFMHFYQYPFFDVDTLGYQKVLLQAFTLLVVLMLASAVFIYVQNRRARFKAE